MSTRTLDTQNIRNAKRLSARGTRAKPTKPAKTAITIVLSGAIVLGICATTWSMLQAEFERTFHEFSARPTVALDCASLHGRDANRADAYRAKRPTTIIPLQQAPTPNFSRCAPRPEPTETSQHSIWLLCLNCATRLEVV